MMKKIIQFCLVSLSLVSFSSIVRSDTPAFMGFYYSYDGVIFFDRRPIMLETDEFRTLYPTMNFGKTDKRAYYKGVSILGVDVESFQAFSNELAADKYQVYIIDWSEPSGFKTLPIENFARISKHYFKDKNENVYFFKKNYNQDGYDFYRLEEVKAKDFSVILEDENSFNDACITISRHKENVYVNHWLIPDLSASNLRILNVNSYTRYLVDTQSIFYIRNCQTAIKVEAADPVTFNHLTHSIFYDKNNFFKWGKILELTYKEEKINPYSLVLLGNNTWGVYNDSLYYLANTSFKEFTNVRVDELKILSEYCKHGLGCRHIITDHHRYFSSNREYFKDDPIIRSLLADSPLYVHGLYNYLWFIEDADKTTFINLASWYAKDKNYVYWQNKIVEDADPETFITLSDTPLESGYAVYAKDDKHVFFEGQTIVGADVDSFEFVPRRFHVYAPRQDIYWKDKNYCYLEGQRMDIELTDCN